MHRYTGAQRPLIGRTGRRSADGYARKHTQITQFGAAPGGHRADELADHKADQELSELGVHPHSVTDLAVSGTSSGRMRADFEDGVPLIDDRSIPGRDLDAAVSCAD
jgi:hypothetical protein